MGIVACLPVGRPVPVHGDLEDKLLLEAVRSGKWNRDGGKQVRALKQEGPADAGTGNTAWNKAKHVGSLAENPRYRRLYPQATLDRRRVIRPA